MRMPIKHWTRAEVEKLDCDARMTGVLVAAFDLIQQFGRGPKAGRPDYVTAIPSDKLTPLQEAVDRALAAAPTREGGG